MIKDPNLKQSDLKVGDKIYFIDNPPGRDDYDREMPLTGQNVVGAVITEVGDNHFNLITGRGSPIVTTLEHLAAPEPDDFDINGNLL